jgi:AraC-like DNA-binding protein
MLAHYIHMSSWIFLPLHRKSEILRNQPVWDYSSISMEAYVIMGVIFLHTLVYLAMAYRHIQRSQNAAADSSSDGRLMVHFRWLRVMSLFMLCYLGGFLTLYTLLVAFGEYGAVLDRGWLLVLSIFVQVIGYIGLQEPSFRLQESAEESSGPESLRPILLQKETVPYARSGLSRSQAMDLSARLDTLMEVEKTFLKSDLKAWDVAQLLDVPVYHLSQALSQIHGCNFFEYVNRYRVVEARRLLVDEQFNHITILAIALEAGFNSKASFNRSFKKVTGSTPSSFRAALSTA